MKGMCTDSRYKNSHKKSAKSFAKAPCKALDIKPRSVQNSQLHSFTASQLHSFTASQLHSFTASQLKGTCAQIKQSPTTKFSHTTRTRPNSCLCAFFIALRIGTIQNTKSYTGFPKGCPLWQRGYNPALT
ncbi:hypothetical protein JM98_02151 [Treponema putidum]|nr:hypothetical protein JM98_02151 [Treponema putidum]